MSLAHTTSVNHQTSQHLKTLSNSGINEKALGRVHLPPTKVFWRLSKQNHFKTTTRCSGAPGFSRRKILRSSAYTISEKTIRFRHPDYDPDRAQKLISSSMSRHLSTSNISFKSMHVFLSNLANRQTNRGKTCTSSFVGGNYHRDLVMLSKTKLQVACLSVNKAQYVASPLYSNPHRNYRLELQTIKWCKDNKTG